MRFSNVGLVAVGLGLSCFAISCSASPDLPVASNNVLSLVQAGDRVKVRDLGSKRDRTVQVEGKIKAQAPLMGGQRAYEVQDDTGSIWIVTGQPVPATGSQVSVQGKVRLQKIDLAGQDQSALYIEQQ
ncbi:hypothetical protein [Leptolyngbya sp. FACHB-17]|uniref:hypothetical protein n=1 Tax=unclassified Leptolyngbya TaxID=2650499 RepID=UPI0016804587|nr:hypothetical protein [Leptolyngbya sp. FACHB-17]MBD2081182.1 hypothetical protein [Leptolyngbya sp. FACHB-17]